MMWKSGLQSLAIATTAAISMITLGTSRALAVDYYGSIAYSRSTQVHGYSYDYTSQAEADWAAIQECQARSGTGDCQVVISFRNACGALAKAPNGAYGSGWGTDRTLAETYAVQSCSQYAGGCQVIRWVCTSR